MKVALSRPTAAALCVILLGAGAAPAFAQQERSKELLCIGENKRCRSDIPSCECCPGLVMHDQEKRADGLYYRICLAPPPSKAPVPDAR